MRKLNEREVEILQIKEERLGKKLEVSGIEYHELFPRTVLCIIEEEPKHFMQLSGKEHYGVSMRSRRDEDNPEIGRVIAFTRALNSL